MSSISILSTTDILLNTISIAIPMIFGVITKKYNKKDGSDVENLIDCIDETQKTFSQNYDGQYKSNLTSLYGQVVNAYADSKDNTQKMDEIIAEFIKSSFNVDPTNKMVELWKRCFIKTINEGKYENLLSYAKQGKNSLILENGQDFHNVNIFLSYCWKDEKKADEIDLFFKRIGIDL